ncbi:response regulator [Corynebacterium kalidii]|uniref:Transcriptional regulatory protein n=1 Tax=Corynebacterium kalidii TaxID=2931982 RepID=A0A9X1WJ17_9CORY|nr:response regulator [Corynebacterium kalidii]MCJ7858472.1 response regulator [Corynebacterium kalidii]
MTARTTTTSTHRDLQVLVVDDDFRVASIHADIVAGVDGFEVQATVGTCAEARAELATRPPDLVLADVYLPDGDGIELVRGSSTDAFVLSAAVEAATVRRALTAGVHAYLVKPFTRQSLVERLDRFLRFRRITGTPHPMKQEEIDRALAAMHGTSQPVTAAGNSTEDLVLGALGTGERSATEVAELTGVSRATAQRRLSALAGRGVVTVRLRYGSSGRPEHLYARSTGVGW